MSENITAYHNWGVFGHDWAVAFLRKSLIHGRTRHAYLITGTDGVGKMRLAQAFAQGMNCTHEAVGERPCGVCRSCKLMLSGNHPDMVYSEQDATTGALRIDAIREVTRMLALKPYDSRYRIGIFDNFHRASPQAQDALLKTLEEPAPQAILIVLASSVAQVLPTISSRCQRVHLRPASLTVTQSVLQHWGTEADRSEHIARLANGRIGWALRALQDEAILSERDEIIRLLEQALMGNRAERFAIAERLHKEGKEVVRYVLEVWQTYWRDMLLLAEESPVKPCNSDRLSFMQGLLIHMERGDILRALQATRHRLKVTLRTNAHVLLALETMMLDYPNLDYADGR